MIPGYPKVMKHPAFVKGIPQEVPPKNYKPKPGDVWFPGTSDRFPDVTVLNPDQQEWYESRGYMPADGTPSLIGATDVASPYQEYPKFIRSPSGQEILVNSVEEESAVMGHGEVPVDPIHPVALTKSGTPRKKPGPKKGSKRKPTSDRMKVLD
jgi:hypothetical protein